MRRCLKTLATFSVVCGLTIAALFPAMAGTLEYRKLIDAQPDLIRKSLVCYRLWDVSAATLEIALTVHVRRHGTEGLEKLAGGLYQTRARVFLLDKIAGEQNLRQLVDEGYAAGAGVDFLKVGDMFDKDCIEGVNRLMFETDQRNELDPIFQKAKDDVIRVVEEARQ